MSILSLAHEHYFLCPACCHDRHAECDVVCRFCGCGCLCHHCWRKAPRPPPPL